MNLSHEEYGFWITLWAIFGYSLLLDFGIGTSIVKYTAQAKEQKSWNNYNKLLSTSIFIYLTSSIIIAIFTIIIYLNIENIFKLDKSNIEVYSKTFLIFGLGMAITFSFGIFKEILTALELISTRNIISIISSIINFISLFLLVKFNYELYYLAIAVVSIQLISNLTMMQFAIKEIPSIRISYKLINKKTLIENSKFSLYLYLISSANLIIFKTDQIVISIFASLSLVGFYQIALRITDIYYRFSIQFNELILPVVSKIMIKKDITKELSKVSILSTKIIASISTIFIILSYLYLEPLLYLWLNLDNITTIITAKILLISMYINIIFRSGSVKILIMSNRERELALVAIIEAISNLILSLILIEYYGVIGVAIGTLIPNVILAIIFNLKVSGDFANQSRLKYFNSTIGRYFALFLLYILMSLTIIFYL